MPFTYSHQFIDAALTYSTYLQGIAAELAQAPKDEAAQKMRPYMEKNVSIMRQYDSTSITPSLLAALEAAPPTTWLVITESWCGDAAFIVPVLAAMEKAAPTKIKLRLALRDSNIDLIDAHLTDGGRAIPKLVVLSEDLKELNTWGPRPAELQTSMKQWKAEGLSLKKLILNVHDWYNNNNTKQIQEEIAVLAKSYS